MFPPRYSGAFAGHYDKRFSQLYFPFFEDESVLYPFPTVGSLSSGGLPPSGGSPSGVKLGKGIGGSSFSAQILELGLRQRLLALGLCRTGAGWSGRSRWVWRWRRSIRR
jgi:hypothetical protein